LVKFSLIEISEALLQANTPAATENFLLLAAAALPPTTNQAACMLVVDVDEAAFPEITKYEFKPSEVVFKSASPQQLFIPLVCFDLELGKNSPRFFLYDMSSEAPVGQVEHLPDDDWIELPGFSTFPPKTNHIRITFEMPQIKDKKYKLNVGIFDKTKDAKFDCDPLVGNDPP